MVNSTLKNSIVLDGRNREAKAWSREHGGQFSALGRVLSSGGKRVPVCSKHDGMLFAMDKADEI